MTSSRGPISIGIPSGVDAGSIPSLALAGHEYAVFDKSIFASNHGLNQLVSFGAVWRTIVVRDRIWLDGVGEGTIERWKTLEHLHTG
ncbi:hypothetical protein CCR95_06080 [Thiocystis minor]|nr:hypothetical protein [Thiocystis minor]